MSVDAGASDFFVAGGTLRPDAPSYVKRAADDELFHLALAGEFCYVLTPRQMGKSSLMVHTARRLEGRGAHTAIIDLTSIGTNVRSEQWYMGLITRLRAQLRLSVDPNVWWAERASLGVVQRFTDFLHDVVLAEIQGPVVIFIDEIDTTLSLDFSDDFFAAIRFTYNVRASDPAYNRLTFVLLGVAAPADLIKDPSRTPFNIGHRVDLYEFSREDAWILQQGLEIDHLAQGKAIFDRIFHWTNGHPYLTQKLCLAVAEARDRNWTDEQIDDLVERLFLSEKARKETNLQFVRDRILTYPQRRQLFTLYREVYRGRKMSDDERSLMQNQLKLSGLIKAEDGYLYIRNEIYRRAFDLAWVRENMPINWAPVVAGIAVFVALLAVGSMLYSFWVGIQFQDCENSFLKATSGERIAHLARVFRLRDPFGLTDYDYKARELFYGMSREEQVALFSDYAGEGSNLVVVIRGLYVTLADVDGTDSTGPILRAMAAALPPTTSTMTLTTTMAPTMEQTEVVSPKTMSLANEISSWLNGRELARQTLYSEARAAYDTAMAFNGENPATLYERARVLIELSEYQQALSDLDKVVASAGRATSPTPTPSRLRTATPVDSSTPALADTPAAPGADTTPTGPPAAGPTGSPTLSLTLTETPTPTATPVPASIAAQFADRGQMISAVRNLIYSHPEVVPFLALHRANYPNLRDFGLVLTPTPTVPVTPFPILALTPSSPSTPDIVVSVEFVVTAERLHIHNGPGENYDVLGTVRRGNQLPLRGRSEDGAWLQVDYLGWVGWIPVQAVTTSIEPTVLPIVKAPPTPTSTPIPPATPSLPAPNTVVPLHNPGFEGAEENLIPGWQWWAEDNYDDKACRSDPCFDTPFFSQTNDPDRVIDGPTLQVEATASLGLRVYILQTVSVPPTVPVRFDVLAKAYSDLGGVRLAAATEPNGSGDCSQAHWGDTLLVNQSDGTVRLVAPTVAAGQAGRVTVCLYAESVFPARSNAAFFDNATLVANPQ